MTIESPPLALAGSGQRAGFAAWIGFGLMCLGMFMAILDVQVVATSLPHIQQALQIDPAAMSWIQTAYLTAEVVAIPLTGWLTRVFTLRWLFSGATGRLHACVHRLRLERRLFDLSLLFASSRAFRADCSSLWCFQRSFSCFRSERSAWRRPLAGVLAVLAPTVGPVVGGWITEAYSWHWLFLVNVTPGVADRPCDPHAAAPRSDGFASCADARLALARLAHRRAGLP